MIVLLIYIIEFDWQYWTKTACNGQAIASCSLQPAPIFNPEIIQMGLTILATLMLTCNYRMKIGQIKKKIAIHLQKF